MLRWVKKTFLRRDGENEFIPTLRNKEKLLSQGRGEKKVTVSSFAANNFDCFGVFFFERLRMFYIWCRWGLDKGV